MRWHRYLTIAAALGVAVAAAPAGASAAQQAGVTAKVVNGALTVTGTLGADTISVGLQPGDPNTIVVFDGVGALPFDRSLFDRIVVNAGDGPDVLRIDGSGGSFTDTEAATLNGQGGDDALFGGSFTETLNGGAGNDTLDGTFGNDVVTGGSGNDTFVWNPGGASDVVDGNSGVDTLDFNGSNIGEHVDLSANGTRLRLTRDVAAVTMDVGGIETVDFGAIGGADVATVQPLAGTGVKAVNVDLGTPFGGDGSVDQVTVAGTPLADRIKLGVASGHVQVTGVGGTVVSVLNPEIADVVGASGLGGDDTITAETAVSSLMDGSIDGGEGLDTTVDLGTPGDDVIGIASNGSSAAFFGVIGGFVASVAENLLVQGLGGNDTITGNNGIASLTALTIDGGTGNDSLRGGDGADRLLGGDGNDFVDGGRGNDTATLGTGDDTFQWDPGDGSDSVEGQTGADTLRFDGSNIGEHVELAKNGDRLRFTRDVGAITMDVHGVESVNFTALAGADVVKVDDLTGTGVTNAAIDLSSLGGGDGSADSVVVDATNHTDAVTVTGSAGSATVAGLAATLAVSGAESAVDGLAVNTLGSDDFVDASALAADAIRLSLDGGAGRDVLAGGAGDDFISGGPGADQISCGPGNDTVVPDALDAFAADCEA